MENVNEKNLCTRSSATFYPRAKRVAEIIFFFSNNIILQVILLERSRPSHLRRGWFKCSSPEENRSFRRVEKRGITLTRMVIVMIGKSICWRQSPRCKVVMMADGRRQLTGGNYRWAEELNSEVRRAYNERRRRTQCLRPKRTIFSLLLSPS